MRILLSGLVLATAFAVGLASGQEPDDDPIVSGLSAEGRAKYARVRREVKTIDLDSSMAKVPGLMARELEYERLIKQAYVAARKGEDVKSTLDQCRQLKLTSLDELNVILKKHQGKFAGLDEGEVWERLKNARFSDVSFQDEWLVNILDDLEERVGINIELDARVYKFDTVSFDFDKSSARAMLQIMGDTLLFEWIVRGDTLYVYKENHEVLFGGDWIRQKKRAWKARRDAIAEATKQAEKEALDEAEGGDR